MPEVNASLEELQAEYDRILAYKSRVIRYYDDCPDGDPRKWAAENKLQELNARLVSIEKKFDSVLGES